MKKSNYNLSSEINFCMLEPVRIFYEVHSVCTYAENINPIYKSYISLYNCIHAVILNG